MLFFSLVIMEIIIVARCWQCGSQIKTVYSRSNKDAVLQFLADLTNLDSPRTFSVKYSTGTSLALIRYNADKTCIANTLQGVSINCDKAGNVAVTLKNALQNSSGIYTLSSSGFSIRCTCLYILGTPSKPITTINKSTPAVRDNVTLTCSSSSTTTPRNHSLSLNYSWKVNNTDNPGDTKYAYTSNRQKLTVSNIIKDDANKQFTCTATEDVTDGYTSISSEPFSFVVYYGPDSARLNVTSPYNLKERDSLAIECIADCYPGCSYTWTNETSGSVITANAMLYVDSVDKYMSGDYKCISKNTGDSFAKSTDIVVNIYIKERTLVKWFYIGNNVSKAFVIVDEQDVDVLFTCKISGDPAKIVRVIFNGDTLKEQTNTNSLQYIRDSVSCFDSGVYKCEGRSEEMEISHRNVSLFVRCSPRPLRKTRENITSSLDIPITMSFEILAYPEPGQKGFTWYKRRDTEWLQILSNEDFQIFSSGKVTNLTIFNVSENDFGRYRVVAENVVGMYHQYFYLLPQDTTKSEVCKEDNNCGNCSNSLTIGIVLGTFLVIAITYAATITIIWKSNVSKTCTTNSIDKGKESRMKIEYVNVASTSYKEQAREHLPQNIESEAAGEDDSNKTQYTELDILSREKNENMYDIIKRE